MPLTSALGWRAVFFINAPIGVAVLAALLVVRLFAIPRGKAAPVGGHGHGHVGH